MTNKEIQEKIYAGVLGKTIGVYMGRPVEGWDYQEIREKFNEILYYPHKSIGVPLIVADDDISGTFGFMRALEDYGYSKDISAKDIGETWLDYIIEDKTILWWGGLGRSTEHTAFLNLKNGISAPTSGSAERNGQSVAEQIGAQIFIEGFSMCFPDDPERATGLVRKAASVSHDGMALEAACHLAALDALAFSEKRMDVLLDEAFRFVKDERLKRLIFDVRNICADSSDWRTVREKLDTLYGYHLYPGSCHVAPNHAMVLAALLCGGDDFQKSVSIAASAGWDTDCNAGNVGALNGIRLGLQGIDAGADLRTEVADRLLVITSDGGEAVSDAVRETRKIVKAMCKLNGLQETASSDKRFSFEYPGSLQGFSRCPFSTAPDFIAFVDNEKNKLTIHCRGVGPGVSAEVSTPTFVEFSTAGTNYLSTASPSLYETQTVSAEVSLGADSPDQAQIQMYVVYADGEAEKKAYSPKWQIGRDVQTLTWTLPKLNGAAVLRMGFSVSSDTSFTGDVSVHYVDWSNAPEAFTQAGTLMKSIWDISPRRLQMWTSSAKGFSADMNHTFCISHPGRNGLATIGTHDWANYSVQATLIFSLHEAGGLAARCKGHRQYYAAVLRDGERAEIIAAKHGQRRCLAVCPYHYEKDTPYRVEFVCKGRNLVFKINDRVVLKVKDAENTYRDGGCGFLIDTGTMLADDFHVSSKEEWIKM